MVNIDFSNIAQFDVIKFAEKIMNEIDSIRSYDFNTDDSVEQRNHTPKESRVNAFFRLIGLPMFVTIEKKDKKKKKGDLSGEKALTPGFFGSKFSEYEISNSKSVENTASLRETTLQAIEENIGTEEYNEKMTKAIKSAMPIQANISGFIGKEPGFNRNAFKQLFPLITSYKEIFPKENEIARPFLYDKQLQMPSNNVTLKKPFLETVIRIRLISASHAATKKEQDKEQEISDEIKDFVGEEEFKIISENSNDVFKSLRATGFMELYILSKLFGSLGNLAKAWISIPAKQERLVKDIDYNISIKTSSGKQNLFGKRASIVSDVSLDEKSKTGIRIKKLKSAISNLEAIISLLPSEDVVFGKNEKEAQVKNTAPSALVDSLSVLLASELGALKKEIENVNASVKNKLQFIEKLRVYVETMTGEFTGISIPDVVCVITALFAIDNKYLVGLLDEYVLSDMEKDDALKKAILSVKDKSITVRDSVEELQKVVSLMFNLLNSLINTKRNKTTSSKRNTRKPKDSQQKNANKNSINYNRV